MKAPMSGRERDRERRGETRLGEMREREREMIERCEETRRDMVRCGEMWWVREAWRNMAGKRDMERGMERHETWWVRWKLKFKSKQIKLS